MTERTITYVPVDELQPATRNPKNHAIAGIEASIGRAGFVEPVIVDERTGRMVGGHGRKETLQAMHSAGVPAPEGIVVDEAGRWLVPAVHWRSRDDADAEALLVGLNQLPAAGGWEPQGLADILTELAASDVGLDSTGYSTTDLDDLLESLRPPPEPLRGDPDAVPEPPVEPVTQRGDLWTMGPHRLVCGDCTDPEVLAMALDGSRPVAVVADPPYGIALQTDYTKLGHGQSTHAYRPIIGDEQPYDPRPVMALLDDVAEQWWWGADYYRERLPNGGSWVVWDKRHNEDGMGLDALFGSHFELCWSRTPHKREVARVLWAMSHGSQAAGEDAPRGLHPTQKPVSLYVWLLDRWVGAGGLVLDPYAGSGVALVACEATKRAAALTELDPAYCDVIARRWQALTGSKPERNGEPHDFNA